MQKMIRKGWKIRMISIKRISEVRRGEYDDVFAIVRSMKSQSDFIKQEALLAPSANLFYKYLDLKKAGEWNQNSFNNIYVPIFLRELKGNKHAIDKLNEIYRLGRDKNIALCCFCTDQDLCHRSIVAGLLQGAGSRVNIQGDYTKYFEMFQNLK